MARALLLMLACASAAAATAGARYSDYAGVKMPHYGAPDYDAPAAAPPAEDYRDQSPDIPAPIDYKYEEESSDKIDKTISNDVEEDESWKKSRKTIKKQKPPEYGDPEFLNKVKLNEVSPKFKNNYRSNNGARYRNKSKVRKDELLSRRQIASPGDENQALGIDDEDIQTHEEDLQGDNVSDSDDDISKFDRRRMSKKVRRKPRDRPNMDTRIKSDSDEEENLGDVRNLQKSLRGGRPEYSDLEERRPSVDTGRNGRVSGQPSEEEVPAPAPAPVSRRAPVPAPPTSLAAPQSAPAPAPPPDQRSRQEVNEYADYYDMKRVHNIKEKFPSMLRRTKARKTATTQGTSASWRMQKPYFRRKFEGSQAATYPTRTSTAATAANQTGAGTTATSSVIVAPSLAPTKSPEELSIAEKSRLSILKKALMKESLSIGTSTNKPPVLLQVTNKLPTVVIVEPPMNLVAWKRGKEISDDTPERLLKVKRLMRQKLLSQSKTFRELTENWDEIICDYIDVGLIDSNAAFSFNYKSSNLFLLTGICLYIGGQL